MRRTELRNYLLTLLCSVVMIQSSALFAQFHEIKHDSISAYGWFGGDDRPGQQRNVGAGQSVLIDTAMTIESFSFFFRGPFDYRTNAENKGHEVTLVLQVHDSAGAVRKTLPVVVPDTFSTGWITWPGINLDAEAGDTMIFTCYLAGGFDTAQYTASHGADPNQGYLNGVMYVKEAANDADFAAWADWSVHPFWDSAFRLQGSLRLSTAIKNRGEASPRGFELRQNYPNPFNPSTTITYTLSQPGEVDLKIFNALGQTVRTFVEAKRAAGEYSVVWDGRDDRGHHVAGGIYYYRLVAGEFRSTKGMLLLQ